MIGGKAKAAARSAVGGALRAAIGGLAERIDPPGGAVVKRGQCHQQNACHHDRREGKAKTRSTDAVVTQHHRQRHRGTRRVHRARQHHHRDGQSDRHAAGQNGLGHQRHHRDADQRREGIADDHRPGLRQRAVGHAEDQKRGRGQRGKQGQVGQRQRRVGGQGKTGKGGEAGDAKPGAECGAHDLAPGWAGHRGAKGAQDAAKAVPRHGIEGHRLAPHHGKAQQGALDHRHGGGAAA